MCVGGSLLYVLDMTCVFVGRVVCVACVFAGVTCTFAGLYMCAIYLCVCDLCVCWFSLCVWTLCVCVCWSLLNVLDMKSVFVGLLFCLSDSSLHVAK